MSIKWPCRPKCWEGKKEIDIFTAFQSRIWNAATKKGHGRGEVSVLLSLTKVYFLLRGRNVSIHVKASTQWDRKHIYTNMLSKCKPGVASKFRLTSCPVDGMQAKVEWWKRPIFWASRELWKADLSSCHTDTCSSLSFKRVITSCVIL